MSGKREHKCVLCDTALSSKAALQEHFRKHANNEIDKPGGTAKKHPKADCKCDMCGKTFETIAATIKHRFKVHPNAPSKFHCCFCGKQFALEIHRDNHVASHDPREAENSDEHIKCEECDILFYNEKALNYHQHSIHNRIIQMLQPIATPPPSNKIKINSMNDALSVYYCHLCGVEYVIKFNLRQHLERVHTQAERDSVPENLIKCTMCNALFCSKKAYDTHNSYHQPNDLYVTSEEQRLQTVTKVDQDFDIRRVAAKQYAFTNNAKRPIDLAQWKKAKKKLKKSQIESDGEKYQPSDDDSLSVDNYSSDSESDIPLNQRISSMSKRYVKRYTRYVKRVRLTDEEWTIRQIYYSKVFPYDLIVRWLSYGKPAKLKFREFGIIASKGVYIRYLSYFSTRHFLCDFREFLPTKIDIGPMYNITPRFKNEITDVYPDERELIFDIDLNDYNDIRTCCTDAKICRKCWKFAAVACKFLDAVFRNKFGFQLLLWVFSGRRGIHCWVCDWKARKLSRLQRQQFLNFVALEKYRETGRRSFNFGEDLNFHVRNSFKAIFNDFIEVCVKNQDILATPKRIETFLKLIPDKTHREEVKKLFEQSSTSSTRWNLFVEYCEEQSKAPSPEWNKRPHLLVEVVLYYIYPRLDTGVSVHLNHMLKAPFSFHPTSRKFCIPFDPKEVFDFNIYTVPSISDFNPGKLPRASNSSIVNRNDIYTDAIQLFKEFVEMVEKSDRAWK